MRRKAYTTLDGTRLRVEQMALTRPDEPYWFMEISCGDLVRYEIQPWSPPEDASREPEHPGRSAPCILVEIEEPQVDVSTLIWVHVLAPSGLRRCRADRLLPYKA